MQATDVFDELIRTFQLEAPALTKDPLGFFAGRLVDSLLGDKPEEFENDVYTIRGVIERLDKLKLFESTQAAPSRKEATLESFRNAVRQSENREAIRLASQIPISELTLEQLREVGSALLNAGVALDDNSDEELRAYDLTVAIGDRVEALGRAELATRTQIAQALVYKGIALGTLNRSEDAILVYDEVVRRLGDSAEARIRQQVAMALFNKGVRLGALNRSEDAIAVYDEVVRRFGDSPEAGIREQVGKALFNKGGTLIRLNRIEEAITVYDEIVRHLGDSLEPPIRGLIAKALISKGIELGRLNRNEDAIAVCDEVVRRLGDAAEAGIIREGIVLALAIKANTLITLNRIEQAIAVCDEVVRRFGDASEPAIRELVEEAKAEKDKLTSRASEPRVRPASESA